MNYYNTLPLMLNVIDTTKTIQHTNVDNSNLVIGLVVVLLIVLVLINNHKKNISL